MNEEADVNHTVKACLIIAKTKNFFLINQRIKYNVIFILIPFNETVLTKEKTAIGCFSGEGSSNKGHQNELPLCFPVC